MWDYVRMALGDATLDELLLVVVFFLCIVSFTWAPRVGEAVGSLFAPDDRDES